MGIEHSFKENQTEITTMRCPCCGYVSTVKIEDDNKFMGISNEAQGNYFVCQNFKCNVERIYSDNAVMVSGK